MANENLMICYEIPMLWYEISRLIHDIKMLAMVYVIIDTHELLLEKFKNEAKQIQAYLIWSMDILKHIICV